MAEDRARARRLVARALPVALLLLSGCGTRPTPTAPPTATPAPTATARSASTPTPPPTPAATPTALPTVPPLALPAIPTLDPATRRYAEEVGVALGRLGEYVAAVAQGCATLDPAACRRAYDANRPLYDREAARVAALTAPPDCAAARDRLNAALAASKRLFDNVDRGLRDGADGFALLGTSASDAGAAGQALQDLGSELANGSCR